ncbi:MAG TPA: hypothetical protein VJM33_19845 [Microthrixaceae bacterium]|nr:hypothetical protein [Microthrixaceae bacterium]
MTACLVVGVLVAGCGDDDDSSSATTAAPTTEAEGDVCADRDALQSSVEELRDVDLTAEGTNGVEAAVGAVKEDLDALGTSVSDELEPEVEAVRTAVDELETAVDDLDSDGGVSNALAAVAAVARSASTLVGSLGDGSCG